MPIILEKCTVSNINLNINMYTYKNDQMTINVAGPNKRWTEYRYQREYEGRKRD